MDRHPLRLSRPVPHPLAAPVWILAACAVLWTLALAVWLYRAERAVQAVKDAAQDSRH